MFSFVPIGCLKLIERNTRLPLTQFYAYCTISLNHSEYPFFPLQSFLKKHIFHCLKVYVCLKNPIDKKKIIANLKGSCFTDKPPTVFKNATSLDKLETPCINMSPFFVLIENLTFQYLTVCVCLKNPINKKKLTANLKGCCFTHKPPTVFKKAT